MKISPALLLCCLFVASDGGFAECLRGNEHRLFLKVEFRVVMRVDFAVWHRAREEERARDFLEVIGEILAAHLRRTIEDFGYTRHTFCEVS